MAADTGVQAVDRAFQLLGLIAAFGTERVGVSELARRSGLAKSTTARLLTTLKGIGAVEVGPDGGIRIGPTIGALTRGVVGSPDLLRQVARPVLAELADVLGEHATLAISSGGEVEYIDQVSSPAAVDAGDWTGHRHAPHMSAAGQILMLDWSRARVERYLAGSLRPNTEATITDPDLFRQRLLEVAASGVAWSIDEFADDVTGCAAAVTDESGEVVAALGLFAPSYRFPSEVGSGLVESELVRAAGEISALLGGDPATVRRAQ